MNRRLWSIVLVLTILFGIYTTTISYAEPSDNIEHTVEDEEDREDEENKEEIDLDLELEAFKFNEDDYRKMINIFLSSATPYFPEYRENGEGLLGKTMFTRLDFHRQLISDKKAKYNDYFVQIDPKILSLDTEAGATYKSDYLSGQMLWRGAQVSSKDYVTFANYYAKAVYDTNDSKDKGLGIDSYGNIITNDMEVVVPFYMNRYFVKQVRGKSNYNTKDLDENTVILGVHIDDKMIKKMRDYKSTRNLKVAYINKENELVVVEDTFENILRSIEGNNYNIDKSNTENFISEVFENIISKHNKQFVSKAKTYLENNKDASCTEVQIAPGDMCDIDLRSDPESEYEELLADKIKTLLNGGMGRLLKLTLAYTVSDAYQELFINFSSKHIFNTSSYEESNFMQNIYGAYLVLVVSIMVLYLAWSAFNIALGKINIMDVLKRVILVLMVLTLPVLIYPKVVNMSFNKPLEKIAKKDMERMLLLDRWALISGENYEENKERAIFSLDRDFRGTEYNYIVKFNTEQFANTLGSKYKIKELDKKYSEEEIDRHVSSINNRRVQVLVDANHLIEYAKSDYDNLFDYLMTEEADNYLGLPEGHRGTEEYTEYKIFMPEKNPLQFPEGYITSSELAKKIFNYYENSDIDLSYRLRAVSDFISNTEYNISNRDRDEMIKIVSSVDTDIYENYFESDLSTIEDEDAREIEEYKKEILEEVEYGDLAKIYDLLKEEIFQLDVDDGVENERIKEMVYIINEELINYYVDIMAIPERIFQNSQDFMEYQEASDDIVKLRLYFKLSELLGDRKIPTGVDTTGIEADVYMRKLVIPMNNMTPDNLGISNASLFVGSEKSVVTIIIFIVLAIILIAYGLLKLLTISIILLPLAMVLVIYNYVLVEDYESKLWYGVIRMIGLFSLIHIGFVALWKIVVTSMNRGLAYPDLVGGRTSYFITSSNMIILITYFVLATIYMIVPTFKTVKANISDLGGSHYYQKEVETAKRLSKTISKGLHDRLGIGRNRKGPIDKSRELKEEDVLSNVTKKEELLNERKMAVKAQGRNEIEDRSDIIDKKIEERKNSQEVVKKEEINKTDGKGTMTKQLKKSSQREKERQENLYKLARDGYFKNEVDSSDVNGKTSNEIYLGDKYSAKYASEYLNSKGINTKVEGEKVHAEATEEELKYHQEGMKEFIESKIEENSNIQVETRQTSSNAQIKDEKILEVDAKNKDKLQELEKSGVITKIDNSGNTTTIKVNDVDKNNKKVIYEDVVSSLNTAGIKLDKYSKLEMDYNKNTMEIAEKLKSEGKIRKVDVEGNSGNRKIVAQVGESNKEEVLKHVEETSMLMESINSTGALKERTVVNSNNDILNETIKKSGLEYGVDYVEKDNKIISLTNKGDNVIKKSIEHAKRQLENMENTSKELKDIKIKKSANFEFSDISMGRRHKIKDLGYSPNDIIDNITNIKNKVENSMKTNTEVSELEKNLYGQIMKVNKIGVEDNKIVLYTKEDVKGNEMNELITEVQRYINKNENK